MDNDWEMALEITTLLGTAALIFECLGEESEDGYFNGFYTLLAYSVKSAYEKQKEVCRNIIIARTEPENLLGWTAKMNSY